MDMMTNLSLLEHLFILASKHNEVYTNPNLTIWTDYEPA